MQLLNLLRLKASLGCVCRRLAAAQPKRIQGLVQPGEVCRAKGSRRAAGVRAKAIQISLLELHPLASRASPAGGQLYRNPQHSHRQSIGRRAKPSNRMGSKGSSARSSEAGEHHC